MPDLLAVQAICITLLLLGLLLRSRVPGLAGWRRDALPIFAGAWLAEDTCIRAYDFYAYTPGWTGWIDQVPVLIPTIWIFVVLSARDVARCLTPQAWLPTAFVVICYDALLIEPVSTTVGLWRWHEAGPFAVPWIGMIGWAIYGAAALFWLERLPAPQRWWTALLAPLTTHAVLLALWWAALRWFGRQAPEPTSLVLAGWAMALALVGLLAWRRRARALPLALVLPRIGPALFFFGLLALAGATTTLWTWAAAFAVPWLVATQWRPGPSSALATDG